MAISGGVRLWLCVALYGGVLIACSIKPVSYTPLGDGVGGGGDAGVTSPSPDAGAPSPTPDAGTPSPQPDAGTPPDPGPQMATLTVQISGDGVGEVVSDDGAISCGTQCTVRVPVGSDVRLRETHADGSFFSGWSNCLSDTDDCLLTVTEDVTVGAGFVLAEPVLHLQLPGNGTGQVQLSTGQVCSALRCDFAVPRNSTITLTAVANANSEFVGWDLPTCGPAQTCDVTMTDDVFLSATFTSTPSLVALSFFSNGGFSFSGNFMPCPVPQPGASACSLYPVGETVVIEASNTPTQIFTGWGGDCATFGTNVRCDLLVTGATPTLKVVINYMLNPIGLADHSSPPLPNTPSGPI